MAVRARACSSGNARQHLVGEQREERRPPVRLQVGRACLRARIWSNAPPPWHHVIQKSTGLPPNAHLLAIR
jgi:hypothetical protein